MLTIREKLTYLAYLKKKRYIFYLMEEIWSMKVYQTPSNLREIELKFERKWFYMMSYENLVIFKMLYSKYAAQVSHCPVSYQCEREPPSARSTP